MDCFGLELVGHQEGWPPAGPVFRGFLSWAPGKGKATPYQKRCDRAPLPFSFPVKQQPADTQRQGIPRLQSC